MSHHQPDPNKNINLTIDGIPVTVPEGTRILEAAKKANINIPVLCEHPELCKRALCRICVVEFDGRPKLITACGNDVWEGVNIVTKNERLFYVRKTILEMILAAHPQNCLFCVRNKSCELQTLAAQYGITSSSFGNEPDEIPPVIESQTLVRDMSKCVKCNRCVEVCQEVQRIGAINTSRRSHEYEIRTAFNQALEDVSCVFCGGCAAVCPVGAIYEYDQTDEVRKALNDSGVKTAAQIYADFVTLFEKEFASVTAGKPLSIGQLIAAIRLLGFDKVYDAAITENAVNSEIYDEVQSRKKSGEKLQGLLCKPIISGYAEGVTRFIKNFYPDLAENLTSAKSLRRQFANLIKADTLNITTVSFVSSAAQKYTASPSKTDFTLTAPELARMIKTAGIVIETLPEEQFDAFDCEIPSAGVVKKVTVRGYAEARKEMEAIHKGECDAEWVEVLGYK